MDSLVERLRAQMEAQSDDDTPSSIQREKGLVWLCGWFDIEAAQADELTRLTAENARLRGAISWIEPPFVDGNTSADEIRQRIGFCVADAKRATAALNELDRI